MYIESVPNRGSPPAILLRESFRDQGRVRKRTLANLSAWPTPLVEGFRTLLKGGVAVAADGIRIRRALPHGHAAAVLGMIRAIGLDRLLGKPTDKRLVPLAIALVASRLISPASKLATARELAADTAASSLGRLLGLGAVDEVELYRALDWLGARQSAIETALARRQLKDGALVLYDVSSSWLEGRCCELARFGYSRDGKKGKLQIVYGLLCTADGCPVAVEVFEGNTADPMTLATQIDKLKERFGLSRVVLVGDRGMITSARIRDELKPAGLDWITALRAPQIRALLDTGAFQLSLFDERDLAEITSPEFPSERLVVCKNPLLAEERARKRQDLLQATEAALAKLADQIARGTGRKGQDKIARAVGRIENRYKLAKLFDITVAEDGFTFARNPDRIAAEARLDGFYVIRTSVEDNTLAAESVVGAYKGLARVERAFRSLKTVDLHIRPIHHWLAPRVRAHVFLCMLACHVEWHMRERLKPMLFDDEDPAAAAAERASIVAPAQSSPAALRKRASKVTADGGPLHSFQTLLRDLATCTLNEMTTTLNDAYRFTLVATPTPVQAQAFRLLDVDPTKL
ncbi:MAG TPA: IS1634 family transposase [Stellaceae bacterium]|jgi:transposase|nr:IS1634 family transposase [Stellaceae bacterium]